MSKSLRSELVDRVIEQFSDDMEDPHEAVAQVIGGATDEEIEALAEWGLYQAYKERMRGFGPRTNEDESNENEDPDQQNESRFNGMDDKLSYPIPIDSSGETKPLKDWTIKDVRRKKSYLHGLRDSIEEKIQHWDKIEHKMDKENAEKLAEIGETEAVEKVIKVVS